MKDFENSGTFRKTNGELRTAIEKPQKAKRMLAEAHNGRKMVEGDTPSIRLMGDIEEVMELIKEFGLEDHIDGIYKNYRDKNKREEYHPANVRVYINL